MDVIYFLVVAIVIILGNIIGISMIKADIMKLHIDVLYLQSQLIGLERKISVLKERTGQ
jgi:hypothetical protein